MIKKAITKKETPVDWERLAKNLQEALAKEMKVTQDLEKECDELLVEVFRHQGVIIYLEKKRGTDPV